MNMAKLLDMTVGVLSDRSWQTVAGKDDITYFLMMLYLERI
jgi:hypothetical protein